MGGSTTEMRSEVPGFMGICFDDRETEIKTRDEREWKLLFFIGPVRVY